MSAISKAIDVLGSQDALAEAAGVSQAAISLMKAGKRRPSAELSIHIEQATDGNVTVEQLRPDVPWHIIRGKPSPDEAA